MIKHAHHALAFYLLCLIQPAFAEAPVVDDSENFAIFDEQRAEKLPVAREPVDYRDTEEEIALAEDNETGSHNSASLLNKLKGMQQEIQELRGQLEVQTHELQLLKQQQLTFYKDLDARLPGTAMKTPVPIPAPIQSPKETAKLNAAMPANIHTNNPADEQISYLAAYDLVKNKRFDEALAAMQTFVSNYPKGGYTANAQYWLGELYMVQKNYPEAIKHFELVLKNFSNSSKAAACSLKIGYALASSGKKEEAAMRLQQVVKNYPDTPTAQLAATKLMSINAS